MSGIWNTTQLLRADLRYILASHVELEDAATPYKNAADVKFYVPYSSAHQGLDFTARKEIDIRAPALQGASRRCSTTMPPSPAGR